MFILTDPRVSGNGEAQCLNTKNQSLPCIAMMETTAVLYTLSFQGDNEIICSFEDSEVSV